MLRLKFMASLLVISILAGCSTPGELRNESEKKSFSSAKDAQSIATCVIDGFEDIYKNLEINGKPTPKGYTVSVGAPVSFGKDTAIVVDIDNTPHGSSTSFYSKLLWGEAKPVKIISDCQLANSATGETLALPAKSNPENSIPSSNTTPQKLRDLQALRKDGVITEEDFQAKKRLMLDQM